MKMVKTNCPLVDKAFVDEKGEVVGYLMNKEALAKFYDAQEKKKHGKTN